MKKNDRFYYLVEGECEKKLIDTFKEQKNIIVPGKVIRFNVIQEHITPAFLRTISDNTTVILVFDTDTNSADILEKNIALLSNHPHIKEVWCVIQVQNLEDEILRSTDLSDVIVLTGSKSHKEYKHDLISEKRLFEKLKKHSFDINKIWVTTPMGCYSRLVNSGYRIKL